MRRHFASLAVQQSKHNDQKTTEESKIETANDITAQQTNPKESSEDTTRRELNGKELNEIIDSLQYDIPKAKASFAIRIDI